jgi:uncharacterized protein YqgV (UPF0045/DUF77 family)
MLAEITVIPQREDPARDLIDKAVKEIAGQGLRYEVGATGTAVEGELDEILEAVRSIDAMLHERGVERAVVEVRLQFEPHPETLEHQVEGIGVS